MKTFNVTTFRCVPEEKVVDYTVMVPQMVEKVVNVHVCKMVPKTITTKVPVCSSRGGCY
jgi:hypothetical protein